MFIVLMICFDNFKKVQKDLLIQFWIFLPAICKIMYDNPIHTQSSVPRRLFIIRSVYHFKSSILIGNQQWGLIKISPTSMVGTRSSSKNVKRRKIIHTYFKMRFRKHMVLTQQQWRELCHREKQIWFSPCILPMFLK